MLNRVYSVLMFGKPANEGLGRRIDYLAYAASPDEVSRQWHRRLVDASAGADAVSANAEWLIQLMLRSSTRDALLTVDPINSYEAVPLVLTPTLDFAAVLTQLRTERPSLRRLPNADLIWSDELLWMTQLASFTLNIVQDNAAY
jgi:hypothetical protein